MVTNGLRFLAGIAPQERAARPPDGASRRGQRPRRFVIREDDGSVDTMAIDHRDGRIAAIYLIRNPEKLQHVRF
jgi:hypothetical protein